MVRQVKPRRRQNLPGSSSTNSDALNGGPTLPPWKAFLVQFNRETSPRTRVFSGRVEHLNSGHRARFGSKEELFAVLAQLLDEVCEA